MPTSKHVCLFIGIVQLVGEIPPPAINEIVAGLVYGNMIYLAHVRYDRLECFGYADVVLTLALLSTAIKHTLCC